MNTQGKRSFRRLAVLAWLSSLSALSLPGQLATTEVMSSSSTNRGSLRVPNGSDFWELTNFGTNTIRLNDYTFTDRLNTPIVPLVAVGKPDLFIQPGESIVFVRTDETTNELDFRIWWGPCLPDEVQVSLYPRTPGFDRELDGIRLYDPDGQLVDTVDFGLARRGVTFVYDTNSGDFGRYSVLGECGTCRAATADDIGSPGTTCGPVPLRILECPVNQSACAGTEAVFSVRAGGLPRPRFQWQRDGTDLPGATASSLVLPNVQPQDAGEYAVQISNGFDVLHCTNFWLTVNTNPSPPVVLAPPVDAEVYAGQNARFAVTVCAYPPAAYQWLSNHVEIAGATNRTLRVADCQPERSGIVYCVRATNDLGAVEACARLIVTPKPRLRITEVMANPATNCSGTEDWLEITNLDTNAFNLLGYRFSDGFSLAGARTITEPVVLYPGESVVLVEQMTPEAFQRWWGADNLPPGLPIVRFVGLGFSYLGDALYLWNAAAEDAADLVDSRSYAESLPGLSVSFNDAECFFGCDSQAGVAGAFRAVECGDVGSPGYTANPPPRFVSITRQPSGLILRWRAIEAKWYRLACKEQLQDVGWTTLGTYPATNSVMMASDALSEGPPQRFYRVEELP